jgi:hypothetical protein
VNYSGDITCHLDSFLFFNQCPCSDHLLVQYTLSLPHTCVVVSGHARLHGALHRKPHFFFLLGGFHFYTLKKCSNFMTLGNMCRYSASQHLHMTSCSSGLGFLFLFSSFCFVASTAFSCKNLTIYFIRARRILATKTVMSTKYFSMVRVGSPLMMCIICCYDSTRDTGTVQKKCPSQSCAAFEKYRYLYRVSDTKQQN